MENQSPEKSDSINQGQLSRHVMKRDPRHSDEETEEKNKLNDNEDTILTDLDVAYSVLFEEANNEYTNERANKEEAKKNGKVLIPQRIYQSFLTSIENDVLEYSSDVNYHKKLIKEESKLKAQIDIKRKDIIKEKRKRSKLQSQVLVLKEKNSKLAHEIEVIQTSQAVSEKAKKMLKRNDLTFSIPPAPVMQQTNPYNMLKSLNESIKDKMEILQNRDVTI